MKRVLLLLLVTGLLKGVLVKADTNLATIQTIQNGFATVKECQKNTEDCTMDNSHTLKSVLELATVNECVASLEDYEKAGIDVPQCPKDMDDLRGLDNTHPTGGIFALYTGDNSLFLKDLISNYLKNDKVGKFNLVLPRTKIESIKNTPEMVKLLNSKRVNIVYVNTMPKVERWMQDSFQFTTIHGKPALYQLEHGMEQDIIRSDSFNTTVSPDKLKQRLACQLAKTCDIPYYVPPDMVDPNNCDRDTLNSGGNLEVLPGGTFLTGVKQYVNDENQLITQRTKAQGIQKQALEKSGNDVLDIDVSFLQVGHVDEMFNFVKTDKPSPCDFAVMMASPQKAFELLEKAGRTPPPPQSLSASTLKQTALLPLSFYASFTFSLKLFVRSSYGALILKLSGCPKYSELMLARRNISYPLSKEEIKEMKDLKCIDGRTAYDFVRSDEYAILKQQSAKSSSTSRSPNVILRDNKNRIVEELKRSTNCLNPPVIEVPVFFRNGLSYTPNLVNGVVQTPTEGASRVILPKSYFAPFDEYVEKELSKHGVGATFTHDMGYHLLKGEVHCGTNSARVCRP